MLTVVYICLIIRFLNVFKLYFSCCCLTGSQVVKSENEYEVFETVKIVDYLTKFDEI